MSRRTFQLPPGRRMVYSHGRWGRRRVRTTECRTFKAEDLYSTLLTDVRRFQPGERGHATYAFDENQVVIAYEIRANSVWRSGRVFFRCPRCERRCTRVYVPKCDSAGPACRLCWGLTYSSRSLRSYKNTVWGRGFIARMIGETQRDRALEATVESRADRRADSLERWAYRRALRKD